MLDGGDGTDIFQSRNRFGGDNLTGGNGRDICVFDRIGDSASCEERTPS